MSLAKQEFTDAGRSMLGRAQNAEVLHITKIVVGSGVKSVPADLWPLTALVSHKLDVTISATRDDGAGTLLVEGSFRSDQAPAVFQLREVGIMAHIGAESDRLYSVANAFADPVDTIDPASPSVQSFKVKLIVDRIPAAQLNISIGPTEAVMGENVGADTVGPGPYKEAVGNVLRFKRLVEGPGIDLTDGPDTIIVAAKTLQNNLDLYVPVTYPGISDPNLLFPSVQAAHDYLLQFVIPTDKFATIHVDRAVLSTASIINFNHPNARQISLIGRPRVDLQVNSITYLSPTSKSVVLAAAPSPPLIVGQRVYLFGCGVGWTGGCKVTAVSGTTITLSTYKRSTIAPNWTTNESGVNVNRVLSYFPSVLVNTTAAPTQDPVISCPNGIRNIENICADGKGYVIQLTDGQMKNIQVMGGKRGINAYQGFAGISGICVFSDCDFGIVSLGPFTAFEATVCNGCSTGLAPGGAGMAVGSITGNMPAAIVYLVNNQYGILASTGGSYLGGSIFYFNNDYGIAAKTLAVCSIGAAYGSVPSNNSIDLYAQGMGHISYDRHQQAVPTCNPPAETVGNQNSLIHVLNNP